MIKILYFASFRERLGTTTEELADTQLNQVGDVLAQLRNREGVWKELFAEPQTVMVAVNQEMADPSTPVKDGDEVAFFPPVTGG